MSYHVYVNGNLVGGPFRTFQAVESWLSEVDVNIDPDSEEAKEWTVLAGLKKMGSVTIEEK